jgi:hypothetical protein
MGDRMDPDQSLAIAGIWGRVSAPRLVASPAFRPRLHLVTAPHSAAGVLGERSGEPLLLGDLMGALLAHAEELGDLDEPYPR